MSATLEILAVPVVDRLYFWALQAAFMDSRERGAGHLGFQWHPSYPNSTAVNWGGYRDPASGGGELGGGESTLPSTLDNPNTRDFVWTAARPYTLRIRRLTQPRMPEGTAWRGEVIDTGTGETTVVRDLYSPGRFLANPVVWSEVFAGCDDPSVTVRWSDFVALTESGHEISPSAVRVSYQHYRDGGCDNTSAIADGTGVLQRTNCRRDVPPGARLTVP